VNQLKSRLCSALDKVQATDDLKNNTVDYLMAYKEENAKTSKNLTSVRLKLALTCASLLLFMLVGGVSYHFYFTSTSYIDVDANPSIGLILNRFGRVINTQAYNEEGTIIINDVNIRFKRYDEALERLFDRIIAKEYLSEEFVAVTVQTDNHRIERDMLVQIERAVIEALAGHEIVTQLEVFSVVEDIRVRAHRYNITPARYLAIKELKAVEPSITIQCCIGYSIGHIRERARRRAGDCENSEGESSRCNDEYRDNRHNSDEYLEQYGNYNKPNNNRHERRGNRSHDAEQDESRGGGHGNNHAGEYDRNQGVGRGNSYNSGHGQGSNQTANCGGNHGAGHGNNSSSDHGHGNKHNNGNAGNHGSDPDNNHNCGHSSNYNYFNRHHSSGQSGNQSRGNDNNHNSGCQANHRRRR